MISIMEGKPESNIELLQEGNESPMFWELIGGKKEYLSNSMLPVGKKPRIFQFSGATGVIEVCEIFNYCQDDLENSSVFLLDCYNAIYLVSTVLFNSTNCNSSFFFNMLVVWKSFTSFNKSDCNGNSPKLCEESSRWKVHNR